MPDLALALAIEADVPRIVELSNWAAAHTTANFATTPEPVEAWVETWRRTHPMHPWLVAREDGRVIGFARSGPHKAREAYGWTAELSVYLDPAAHGRGVGTTLYGELLPRLTRQGYVTLLAGITAGHAASERLHAKFGFAPCGTFHRSGWKFGAWHDVTYWELHLQPADQPPRAIAPVER